MNSVSNKLTVRKNISRLLILQTNCNKVRCQQSCSITVNLLNDMISLDLSYYKQFALSQDVSRLVLFTDSLQKVRMSKVWFLYRQFAISQNVNRVILLRKVYKKSAGQLTYCNRGILQ